MKEEEFISKIDACFPFDKPELWDDLISESLSISVNATFMILFELCHSSYKLESKIQKNLFLRVDSAFKHPLYLTLRPAILKIISKEELSVKEARDLMLEVGKYKDQYNALSIPYFACDDKLGENEKTHNQIKESWKG